MARPLKQRIIYQEPLFKDFACSSASDQGQIILTVDEYQTVFLLDYEGLSQEEAAYRMGVARTTVTSIYASARKKLAAFLVKGGRLKIGGGSYEVRDLSETKGIDSLKKEGKANMKVAVSYENGNVFQHFGQTPEFKFYEIKDGHVISSSLEKTNGVGHKDLIPWLKERKTDVLICGGIGGMAIRLLKESNIVCFGGVQGKEDKALNDFINNRLQVISDPTCTCSCDEHKE
jgi:predicted DNA-binding protein (UPF0251 family)/predicted Fe-Mo cluster-binding NifX family protein